jgi:hypothetical protein
MATVILHFCRFGIDPPERAQALPPREGAAVLAAATIDVPPLSLFLPP